ncbi:NAD(P)/FAD-dependent oxidoreductase, partial [Mammaliicoccus sciuri]|uniref:FAD-dependent oxidoreductase n=1 Tax=Mammaliicoccus sciuri TaxID=1296 RepID=UPI00226F36EC
MLKSNKNNKVAIIGGGPGGLMLGLLLQKQGIPFTIFEKGERDINGNRGGSLDIHEESGQLPIKEAGLIETFKSMARFEGEDTKILGPDGTLYFEDDAEGEGGRPEIDRGELCDMILTEINPENIRYHYEFKAIETLDNHKVKVTFNHNVSEIFDVVVGADGSFSDVKQQFPDLAAFNKNGKIMALSGDQAILGQLNGDGSIKVYVTYRMPYKDLDTYKALSPDQLKSRLLQDFKDWDKELLKYISYADDKVLFRRIYKLPIGFKWERQSNVTLLGDAAHVMSPFAGEGVNTALYDAYLLARAFKNHDNLEDVITAYEDEMYKASEEHAQESQDNLDLMFSNNAAEKMGSIFT